MIIGITKLCCYHGRSDQVSPPLVSGCRGGPRCHRRYQYSAWPTAALRALEALALLADEVARGHLDVVEGEEGGAVALVELRPAGRLIKWSQHDSN